MTTFVIEFDLMKIGHNNETALKHEYLESIKLGNTTDYRY